MSNPNSITRGGFSLIELLIVILIMSMIYFLGFSGVELNKPKPKPLTPANLKENIVSSELFNVEATLLCIDECRSCYLRRGISNAFAQYSSPIDLSNISVYKVDSSDSLIKVEYGRYQDKKICLEMEFYRNGSSTQLIIQNDKASYFLPAFFGEPKEFETPEEAQDYWLKNSNIVSDSGAFY